MAFCEQWPPCGCHRAGGLSGVLERGSGHSSGSGGRVTPGAGSSIVSQSKWHLDWLLGLSHLWLLQIPVLVAEPDPALSVELLPLGPGLTVRFFLLLEHHVIKEPGVMASSGA